MTPGYYEPPFIVNTTRDPVQLPLKTVHFHSCYSEFRYSEKTGYCEQISVPEVHYIIKVTGGGIQLYYCALLEIRGKH